MRRLLLVLGVPLLLACTGDDDTTTSDAPFWEDFNITQTDEVDGHTVGIDPAEQVLYIEDCPTARLLVATDSGNDYAGWAYICND